MSIRSDPASGLVSITPSDTADIPGIRALWVGGAGNIAIDAGNGAVTLVGVAAGSLLPIQAKRVMATNTTADDIVGML